MFVVKRALSESIWHRLSKCPAWLDWSQELMGEDSHVSVLVLAPLSLRLRSISAKATVIGRLTGAEEVFCKVAPHVTSKVCVSCWGHPIPCHIDLVTGSCMSPWRGSWLPPDRTLQETARQKGWCLWGQRPGVTHSHYPLILFVTSESLNVTNSLHSGEENESLRFEERGSNTWLGDRFLTVTGDYGRILKE